MTSGAKALMFSGGNGPTEGVPPSVRGREFFRRL
jgi:hypothetical protein